MFLGFAMRIASRFNPTGLGLYAVCNLFVILSPLYFIAFAYMMYARFMQAMDPNDSNRLLPLRPRLVGRLFIASDIICFIIQCAGGSLQIVGTSFGNLGNNLFVAGVILQTVSYLGYLTVVLITHWRCHRRRQSGHATTRVFALIYVASAGILVRSTFRIVEMAQGYQGVIYRTEWYLFVLNALPLAIANMCWVFYWPSTLFRNLSQAGQDLWPMQDTEDKAVGPV